MTKDEKLVRETWEDVSAEDHTECCGPKDPFIVWLGVWSSGWKSSFEEAWKAAADFTRQRLHEVREVEQELSVLTFWVQSPRVDQTTMQRTIRRLEATRDDLKRGMK